MEHYKREYSAGSVKPYARRGKTCWRGTVTEYTVVPKTDEHGAPMHKANGDAQLEKHRKTLTKTFDIPCSLRRDGSGKYTNAKKAEEAFTEWRNNLLAKAEEDYARAIEEDKNHPAPKYDHMPVPAFLDMYISEREQSHLEPSTIDSYRFAATYAKGYFSTKSVGEVTTDDLKSFERSLSSRGLSSTTRLRALKTMKAAFDYYRKKIGSSPFDDRSELEKFWPSPKKADPNPLDEASINKVLGDLESSPCTSFMCAVELALRTAMRIGEVCALRWDAVDIRTGKITVCRAIGRVRGGTALYEKTPKNTRRKKSDDEVLVREVGGDEDLVRLFERRIAYMVCELLKQRPTMGSEEARRWILENTYVVGGIDGGFANPTVMGRTWRGYSQGLMGIKGRRPTFHALRDTWISGAITKAHIDPNTVAEMAGHSDPGFTMRVYAASDASVKQAAQEKMAQLIKGGMK